MRCPSCGFANAEGMAFCTECGARLQTSCPGCGFENALQAKFCGKCGTTLGAIGKPPAKSRKRTGTTRARKATRLVASPTTARSQPAAPEAERRQLTVMFCDLVGSTPLAEKLDPEDLRRVILAYQQTCAEQIRRFEGYLARYVGDGLLVYFGYPQAHEDDAQRAIRAGLGIVAALPELNTRLQQTVEAIHEWSLQVRIGIHTGLVVVGDMGGGGYRDPLAIVGETPNVAARVQGIAEPNTVVISEATSRLVQGLFECQACGPQALKGVSMLVPVYRVLRESAAQSRFEVAVSTGLTPLVGREEELGLLQRRWEQAKSGEGQVILLRGEPGMGKSRLVQTLKEQAITEGATRIEFRCSPYHQNSAFYPIIEHLQRVLQFAPHDPPPAKVAKLTQRLAAYRFPQADTLPLLAALLSLPPPEGTPPLTVSPQKQKQKTQEALVAWFVEDAEKVDVYCAWEDLHWADPSTLAVLTLFLAQVPTTRLLAVLTFRPEFMPPWGTRSHLSQLTLSRLGRSQVEAMVEQVTGGKALPPEVVQQIVAKTDGVPLFVEELTKMVLESGLLTAADNHYELIGPLSPLAIPSTLQDSLMARLDRLAAVKEVAQVGATLGREFSYELLQAVLPLEEGSLQQGLRQLVEAELLYQRGLPPQATYLFKHALIQDTAYQSLLKSKRQHYHRQIAQVFADRFPETVETLPELVAHHYTEAGLIEQAIPYWQQAGQKATERSANQEAINHLTKGLDLLQVRPDTPERAQQELTLRVVLGPPLQATKGFAAPEVERVYTRVRELCQQVGEIPQRYLALSGLNAFDITRAEYQKVYETGEQLLHLAQSRQDREGQMRAHQALGITLFWLGEFISARAHLEQLLALYDPLQPLLHVQPRVFSDLKVATSSYQAFLLQLLGYPDQALQKSREALTLTQGLTHPFSLVYVLNWATYLQQVRGEGHRVHEQAEALVALCTEHGFAQSLATGVLLRGWALAKQEQREEGITQLRQGLAARRNAGAENMRPYYLVLLAEAHGKVGQPQEGLSALAEALSTVNKTGERFYEAELYRLKGELTLQQLNVQGSTFKVEDRPGSEVRSPAAAAEECFLQALAVGRKQQAKSLELRAAMNLSRLWQQQGKKEEARKLLAEIYGWFTEGFETKDLQEAKELLEELT